MVVVVVVLSKTKNRRILPWGETWTSASLGSWGLFLLRENMGGKFMATSLNSWFDVFIFKEKDNYNAKPFRKSTRPRHQVTK